MKRPAECPTCEYDGDDFRPLRNLSDASDKRTYGFECGYCGARIYGGEVAARDAVRELREQMDRARDRRLFGNL